MGMKERIVSSINSSIQQGAIMITEATKKIKDFLNSKRGQITSSVIATLLLAWLAYYAWNKKYNKTTFKRS